ncbi:MAG: leucine-rich repeat domain-containing protein, partial [Prevotella sp.]
MRQKTNRLIPRVAMTLLLSVLTTMTAWAYGIADTGSCGISATYAITGSEGNYTLTISGTGKISDYAFCHKDLSGIKSVVINEGITSIDHFSFQKDGNYAVEFTSVSFPSTLTTIGWGAFQGCTSLTAVHIPASVTKIDGRAFYGCTGLSSVTIASGSQLQTIYSNAFYGCSFTEIVLPCAQLSSIGEMAFSQKSLTKIVCLTETSLNVDQNVFTGATSTPKDVYMYASKKVNWPGANSVRALYTLSAGTNVTAISGTKSYGDYYGEGTTITVSTTCNRPGFTVGGMPVAATSTGVSGEYTLTLPSLSADAATVSASEASVLTNGSGTENDPYRISSVSDWNTFAGMINAGIDADKDYVLTTDIGTEQNPVTTMVGTINTPFRGTLNHSDAFNKTITVALSSSTDDCALFGCLDGAEVRYLNVRGTITTSAKYAASIAAHNKGKTQIWFCTSYATIESTAATTSDGTHGGFVAVNERGGVLGFYFCAFKGKLLGANATNSSGFVGYNGGESISYDNCLFAPTEITMSASGSATFNRNGRKAFDSSHPSYYTQPFGEAQGTQVYASTDDIPASYTYTTVEACDDQTYYLVTGMTIGSTADWTAFAEAVNSGNSFAGLTVKLAEDFDNTSNPVTTMVGTSTNKFSGTFDGQDRTLNVELTSEGEYTAPFRYVNGGTFKNLRTAGTVTTSHKYATGLIGSQAGSTTIQNCHSSVTIISSVNGDGTHGGFIATGGGNFQGCVFDGVICTTTEYTDTPTGTNSCGGFVGWNSSSVTISNSLYAPAAIPEGMYRIGSTGSATFARGNTPSLTNSYYTEALGTAQGSPVPVPTFAPEGYATFYSSVLDVVVPEGMKARIVTGSADGGKLTYQDVADGDAEVKTVPAGTAVMLQVEAGTTAGSLGYDIGTDDRDFTTAEGNDDGWVNLLHGSDVATTTTGGAKYYKLSYNDGYTNDNKVIGWYWGADGG